MEIGAVVGVLGGVGALALYVIRGEIKGEVARVDGRINTHEAECEQRNKNADERHVAMTKTLDDISKDVKALLGHQQMIG